MTANLSETWTDVGLAETLAHRPIQQIAIGRTLIALVFKDGEFSAISGVCNHVGGPLGQGRLEGDYVVCPWHAWKFHRRTGEGEPGFEEDRVPSHAVRVEGGRVLVKTPPDTPRRKKPHEPHPLTRLRLRGTPEGPPPDAPLRVVGISTTVMDDANPRESTSDFLLGVAMDQAAQRGAETRLIRLRELRFRACEGYYSKSARACTWPCSITQMDPNDQLDRVYEAIVGWADVFVVATPIRWGNASSLYYKMAERMNCVQNQITTANRVLMRNKVATFIITGGQDNVQGVAGQLLTFFGELGCAFPPFPFVGHSRGWDAEDMENNVSHVEHSEELRVGVRGLVDRALELAHVLIEHPVAHDHVPRGGRKAHSLGSGRRSQRDLPVPE
jgi:nitrite reductase/ring-hydroxylating ferredoxin subunit/multimeric flavodoxin WrbA